MSFGRPVSWRQLPVKFLSVWTMRHQARPPSRLPAVRPGPPRAPRGPSCLGRPPPGGAPLPGSPTGTGPGIRPSEPFGSAGGPPAGGWVFPAPGPSGAGGGCWPPLRGVQCHFGVFGVSLGSHTPPESPHVRPLDLLVPTAVQPVLDSVASPGGPSVVWLKPPTAPLPAVGGLGPRPVGHLGRDRALRFRGARSCQALRL